MTQTGRLPQEEEEEVVVVVERSPFLSGSKKTATERYYELHGRIPYVRRLPAPVVGIIVLVGFVNALAWAGCGIALHFHKRLLGTSVLAYTLGLRHALDADHISAIDLMTRRLVASGQRPVTVGTWFSLGHSTIVIITSVAVAATAAGLSERFDSFSRVGGIIGTSVSAAFLVVLGALNGVILWRAVRRMRVLIRREEEQAEGEEREEEQGALFGAAAKGGCMLRVFQGAFKAVDRPWKMYPLGVLFGLGFDTSSEVALLGIASIQGSQGTSIWLILIFPILFTGMCLLDTTDGALMSALYSTRASAHDELALLYYSVVLTLVTVVVAVVIGAIQLLSLVAHVAAPRGRFWRGVGRVADRFEIVGAAIVALFAVVAVAAVVGYRPWRAWVEGRRARRARGRGVERVERVERVEGVER